MPFKNLLLAVLFSTLATCIIVEAQTNRKNGKLVLSAKSTENKQAHAEISKPQKKQSKQAVKKTVKKNDTSPFVQKNTKGKKNTTKPSDPQKKPFRQALKRLVKKNDVSIATLEPNTKLRRLIVKYAKALQNQPACVAPLASEIYLSLKESSLQKKGITVGSLALALLNALKPCQDYDIVYFKVNDHIYFKKQGICYYMSNDKKYIISQHKFNAMSLQASEVVLGEVTQAYQEAAGSSLLDAMMEHPIASGIVFTTFLLAGHTCASLLPEENQLYSQGMWNLGNTCFFNSMTQAYAAHNPVFIKKTCLEFRDKANQAAEKVLVEHWWSKEKLYRKWYKLLQEVQRKRVSAQSITDVFHALESMGLKGFTGRQEDPQEYLIQLLSIGDYTCVKTLYGRKNIQFPLAEPQNRIKDDLTLDILKEVPMGSFLISMGDLRDDQEIGLQELINREYNGEEFVTNERGVYSFQTYVDLYKNPQNKDESKQKIQRLNNDLLILELRKSIPENYKNDLPSSYQAFTPEQWLKIDKNAWNDLEAGGTLRKEIMAHNKKPFHQIPFFKDSIFDRLKTLCLAVKERKLENQINSDPTENITTLLTEMIGISPEETKRLINNWQIQYNMTEGADDPAIRYEYQKVPKQLKVLGNKMSIHLSRFCNDSSKRQTRIKDVMHIEINNEDYDLDSAVIHHGSSLFYGHYTAVVKTRLSNGQVEWSHRNNTNIYTLPSKEYSLDDLLSHAYMLFYTKRTKSTKKDFNLLDPLLSLF